MRGLGKRDDGEHAIRKGSRCAEVKGFSVHADRFIGQQERGKLTDLIEYAARPAVSNARLSRRDEARPDGDVVYKFKKPWDDGTDCIILSQDELIEKVAALIPPPYVHMSRYFGVLSSHSKHRPQIIVQPLIKRLRCLI